MAELKLVVKDSLAIFSLASKGKLTNYK